MLKRYLLFYGDNYYPSGGWLDFQGSFATVEEAREKLSNADGWKPDWHQIIDTSTGEEIS